MKPEEIFKLQTVYSSVSTHSLRRRPQQEAERTASPGPPFWSARWTGSAPAGAAAG